MRHWEKTNKKEQPRRIEERDPRNQDQDYKKKKLKPIEKTKYKAKSYYEQEEE